MTAPASLLVLVSVPPTHADAIAEALVENRVAACVSVLPGLRSIYPWQGSIERADETLLLAKTTSDAYPALEAQIRARHPYELPEIIAVEIATGLPDYLKWLSNSVQ